MALRHLLSLDDLTPDELRGIIDRACVLKAMRARGERPLLFARRVLAMIFEKSSTRTRVSFEAAMIEGGGGAIFLSPKDSQLGRGEAIEDTARVLSRMCDAIMVRTFAHTTVETFAAHASVPVINGLTDRSHPCQVVADLQTYHEHRGDIAGRRVAWIGDGNNMCHTYIEASRLLGFDLTIATPAEFAPDPALVAAAPGVTVTQDPAAAARGADLIVTDVWVSMGQEAEAKQRLAIFAPYRVDRALMALAQPDALFMHCLPAHRGEEVTAEVIDDTRSVVWDEAGNRLHAQKALLEFLLAAAVT